MKPKDALVKTLNHPLSFVPGRTVMVPVLKSVLSFLQHRVTASNLVSQAKFPLRTELIVCFLS